MTSLLKVTSSLPFLGLLLAVGCSGGGGQVLGTGGSSTGGTSSAGGSAPGGTSGTGGLAASGGAPATGGTSASGGGPGTGGAAKTGGTTGTKPPALGGGPGSGGNTGTAGAGKGGTTGAGGSTRRDGGPGAGGATGTGGDAIDGGPNCNATMPTEGGKSYTGNNGGSSIDGFGYGIWSNGKGGTITVFPNHAWTANWNESEDFLAHFGLDYRGGKNWTDLGTIVAEYSEKKSGTSGSFSMIGMYGWTNSPCVEWYINEDAWNGLYGGDGTTATIDGGTYSLSSTTTTGTGGANAC
jgi:hypothetical protein